MTIAQGSNGVQLGTGYNTSLNGFGGTVNLQTGVAYVRSLYGLSPGTINIGNGATMALWTGTSTTFYNPITLNGLGGTNDGYAKPAIYGDGGSGAFTLSGQITLAATSDIGNYAGNSTMTINSRITGPGGLVLGKAAPTLADEYGAITFSGNLSNDYSGGTTINRGTVYLARTDGAIAIPGNVTINTSTTAATGSTWLILNGGYEIAQTAVMNFSGVYGSQWAYFDLQGNSQTVAGINDTSGAGVIEHAESENNITSNSTFCVNTTAADSYFNGYLRDGNYGSGSTGTLALLKGGSYKLTLVGSNVSGYTGGTTVSGGTLQFGDGTTNAVLPGNATVYSGATLAFNVAASTAVSYSGVISSTGNFSKLGAGTLTISGAAANTYTGTTTFTGGTVYLSKTGGAVAIPGNLTINDGAARTYVILGGNNEIASVRRLHFHHANLLRRSRTEWLPADPGRHLQRCLGDHLEQRQRQRTLTVNNSSNYTFAGALRDTVNTNTGKLSLAKSGTGTLVLTNTNNYSGTTTVSAGALQADNAAGLPNSSYLVLNGGVLQSNSTSAVTFTRGLAASGSGTFQFGANGGGFSAGSAAMNVNIGGASGM